jgi:hypothetical protein
MLNQNDIIIQLFENLNENVRTCALGSLIHQSIDQYIPYLCCEYQLICTFNKWSIGILILANQIQAHLHARAGWHFSVCQSRDVNIICLCCKYKLIWTYNEWFINISILANQIQAHVHACSVWHFRCANLKMSTSSTYMYAVNIHSFDLIMNDL